MLNFVPLDQQSPLQRQSQDALLKLLIVPNYPATATVLIGGCDDPTCSCGGIGPQAPKQIIHDTMVN